MKKILRLRGQTIILTTATARGKSKDNSFKQTQTEPVCRFGQIDIVGKDVHFTRLPNGELEVVIQSRG